MHHNIRVISAYVQQAGFAYLGVCFLINKHFPFSMFLLHELLISPLSATIINVPSILLISPSIVLSSANLARSLPSVVSHSASKDSYDFVPSFESTTSTAIEIQLSFLESHPSNVFPTPTNQQHMQTRSKSDIFKLKTYAVAVIEDVTDLVNQEPNLDSQALNCPHWRNVMSEEYKALMNSNIWTIVLP